MGKIPIKIVDGIIHYSKQRHDMFATQVVRNLTRFDRKTFVDWNEEAKKSAETYDFWSYLSETESAIYALRLELFEAYSGKIPLEAFEKSVEMMFKSHQCNHLIDVKRDELNSGGIAPKARKWEKQYYSWKEAVIEESKKKFPEIDNLGRQKDGKSR